MCKAQKLSRSIPRSPSVHCLLLRTHPSVVDVFTVFTVCRLAIGDERLIVLTPRLLCTGCPDFEVSLWRPCKIILFSRPSLWRRYCFFGSRPSPRGNRWSGFRDKILCILCWNAPDAPISDIRTFDARLRGSVRPYISLSYDSYAKIFVLPLLNDCRFIMVDFVLIADVLMLGKYKFFIVFWNWSVAVQTLLCFFYRLTWWYFDVDHSQGYAVISFQKLLGQWLISVNEKSPDFNFENHNWVILTLIVSLLYISQVFLVAAVLYY